MKLAAAQATDEVDIYPVGLLHDLREYRRSRKHMRHASITASQRLRRHLRYPFRMAARREWRAVKNYFNGYLAEPREMPPGCWRCGTGWTKNRALRDYQRHARRHAIANPGQSGAPS